ncbi:DUF6233 domain-containing protein [Streptomyces sp. NPDC046832]|uniref:DUF6233 domain-containing protein n=1 Tax=Streptomyces sp. NPDC046832 TaxID=3155020 RepID=UPI0033FD40BF
MDRPGRHRHRAPPVQVHAGDSYASGNRHPAINRDEARRLLASGPPAPIASPTSTCASSTDPCAEYRGQPRY